MTKQQKHRKKHGFSLVELSIVLMIIGLLVGGVMVGKDLIKAAEMRATMAQVEQFKAASKTFTLKYNCNAGDCHNATSFLSGTSNGDGNGFVGDVHNPTTAYGIDGVICCGTEILLFWQHLALANLIPNKVYVTNTVGGTYTEDINFPSSKLGGGFGIFESTASSLSNPVLFWQGKIFPNKYGRNIMLGSHYPGATSMIPLLSFVSGNDAFAIDTKYDDGLPGTGNILTWAQGSNYGSSCATTTNPSTAVYNKTSSIVCSFIFPNALQ